MMFVSLLNTIGQIFFQMVIKVLNLLILFIQMYGDLHLFLISRVQNCLTVSFIDDCTRVTWIFLMKDKSKVFYLYVKFCIIIQTQFESPIKRLRSDYGREYVNQNFSKFLHKNGVVHELTCVDTPQQNGVAKSQNRHLLEVTRVLLFQTSIPRYY